MRILYISTGLGVGGAEKVVISLSDEFSKRGHKVSIVSLMNEISLMPKSEKVAVYSLGIKKIWDLPRGFFELVKILKVTKPDIIHSHMFHANILARVARLFYRVPKLVSTAHSSCEGGLIRSILYRTTNFLSDTFTNVSQEAVDAFVTKKIVRSGEMIAVPNGVNFTEFFKDPRTRVVYRNQLGLSDSDFVFLAIGRLDLQKDYPNLLTAFSLLVKSNPRVRLLIAGDGILRDSLIELTRNLQISDKVSFLGVRKDIKALLNSVDAFVLSSELEGFSLVVLEAMSCEVCVVATDSGGPKEVLGGHGILVPIKNSVALMNAMLRVYIMPLEEREEMGKKLRRRAEQAYSIDSIVKQWENIYTR